MLRAALIKVPYARRVTKLAHFASALPVQSRDGRDWPLWPILTLPSPSGLNFPSMVKRIFAKPLSANWQQSALALCCNLCHVGHHHGDKYSQSANQWRYGHLHSNRTHGLRSRGVAWLEKPYRPDRNLCMSYWYIRFERHLRSLGLRDGTQWSLKGGLWSTRLRAPCRMNLHMSSITSHNVFSSFQSSPQAISYWMCATMPTLISVERKNSNVRNCVICWCVSTNLSSQKNSSQNWQFVWGKFLKGIRWPRSYLQERHHEETSPGLQA